MSATQSRSGADASEVPLDEVRRRCHLGIAPRRARPFPTMAALQPGEAKQARHPLARAADTLVAQFGMDARRAVGAPAPFMNRPNPLGEHEIALRACRGRSLPPGVIAAARDAEHTAQQGDGIIRLLHLDEREHR